MEEPKRVYISGKITGLPMDEWTESFDRGCEKVENMGMDPIDPTILQVYDLTYEEYMKLDLMLLETCDAIYMLKGWEDSPGANREHDRAKKLGLEIMYER